MFHFLPRICLNFLIAYLLINKKSCYKNAIPTFVSTVVKYLTEKNKTKHKLEEGKIYFDLWFQRVVSSHGFVVSCAWTEHDRGRASGVEELLTKWYVWANWGPELTFRGFSKTYFSYLLGSIKIVHNSPVMLHAEDIVLNIWACGEYFMLKQ